MSERPPLLARLWDRLRRRLRTAGTFLRGFGPETRERNPLGSHNITPLPSEPVRTG